MKALEETVIHTEAQLGFRPSECYRGFLMAVDGCPCFLQDMTILSTSDLLRGKPYQATQPQLTLLSALRPWLLTMRLRQTTSRWLPL